MLSPTSQVAPRETQRRALGAAIFAIVVVGVILRVIQYAANTSLWLDEIALVKGILGPDLFDLVARPLPFDQVAPKGFLIAQKLVVEALGPSDYALRLIPFLASVVGLVGFARFTKSALAPVGAVAATAMFASAAPLVAFAGIVKQYSTDVCVAVLLALLTFDLVTRPVTNRTAWRAAGVGAALVWFSQPAVLMVAALACPLLFWMESAPANSRPRHLSAIVGLWGASAIAVTASALVTMSPGTVDYMRTYWADGFPPPSVIRAIQIRWPWQNVVTLFGAGANAQASLDWPSPLYPVLVLIGLATLLIRQRRLGVIVVAPIVLTLVAAVFQQYPFRDRLILFLLPLAIVAAAAALTTIHDVVARFSRRAALVALAGLTIPTIVPIAKVPPPHRVEDVKTVLAQIATRRQSDDNIYIYYGAASVTSVYDSAFGLTRDAYAVGGCHRGDSRQYLQELDTFRGSPRLWVVITHSLPVYREREDILGYLDSIGTRLDYVRVDSRAIGRIPSRQKESCTI